MAMSSERLNVLVKVAESRTEVAAQALGRTKAGLNEQEERLSELRRYMDEYRTRPLPLSPALIANRELFLARLGEAELQQVRAVNAAQAAVRESTRGWLEHRAGQQKFGVLQAAAVGREERQAEQLSQKQMDEFSLRRYALGGEKPSE